MTLPEIQMEEQGRSHSRMKPALQLCCAIVAILVSSWVATVAIAMTIAAFYFQQSSKTAAIKVNSNSQHHSRFRGGGSGPTTTTRMLGRRILHDQRAHFHVQLFLDLQFVDESLALDFETLDETNPNIQQFCKAIQRQVSQNDVYEVNEISKRKRDRCFLAHEQTFCT